MAKAPPFEIHDITEAPTYGDGPLSRWCKRALYEARDEVFVRLSIKVIVLMSIAGYVVANDVSERAFQAERQGQWTKGKSCDTFGPIGPWLVTKDEVKDPQDLKMWCTVNGKTMQDGSTSTMVYGVKHLVSYLSQFMSLLPGDVISTGTPPGVGMGMKPPLFLKDGDVVELGIEGLGTQKQTFRQDA